MKLSANLATDAPSAKLPTLANSGVTCLLVENSRFDRKRIQHALAESELSLAVLEADSLTTARDALSAGSVDILILDNDLPDGLGLVLVQELQQIDKLAELPVIMVSDDSSKTLAQTALASGCSDFLAKEELSPERLSTSIQTVLAKAREVELSPAELTSREVTQLMQLQLRDSVIELNTSVLRIARLSRKLQRDGEMNVTSNNRVIAAEIQAVSDDLHRKLNAMLAENAGKQA